MTTTSTVHIRNPILTIVRIVWVIFVIAAIVLLVVGLPDKYQARQIICDGGDCLALSASTEQAEAIEKAGLSLSFLALWEVGFLSLSPLVFISIAAFIFLRRSDEMLAVVVAFAFIGVSWPLTSWEPEVYIWGLGLRILSSMTTFSMMGFLLIFPSGRFVPRWAKWYWIAATVTIIALETFGGFSPDIELGISFIFFLLPLGSQIYRYIRVSTLEEQQQTKWMLMGVFAIQFVPIFELFIVPSLGTADLLVELLIVMPLGTLGLILIPIGVLIAIQKRGLWDINFIINRSLVYGGMTLILVGLIGGSLLAVSSFFEADSGGQSTLIALTASALLFGLIFNPMQKSLRRFVDRRFYGIEVDYHHAATKFESLRVGGKSTTSIGEYKSLKLLGRGGMGEVYLAEDTGLKRQVAIKVLPSHLEGEADITERFMREAQAIAALKHPNIVTLHEVGEQDGSPYMVMEYIDGGDLSERLKREGQIDLADLLPLLEDVASALDYAHGQGIVHRDIKPSNVMIESLTGRAVLMDFGIARIASAMTALTGTGGMVGTLDYIAPEQIQGAKDVDGRADIYSFGVMTYHLLTGEKPFKKANAGALVMAHLMEPPPDPRKLNPDLSRGVMDAIGRAMAKKPESRFGTAEAFVHSLEG